MSNDAPHTVHATERPSSLTPPARPGCVQLVSYIEFIQDPLLREVERLSAWLIRREQMAEYGEEIDLAMSLPVDLPMLVLAATEHTREWVIAMVADLTIFDLGNLRYNNDCRYDFDRLNTQTKPELLELARVELTPRKLPSASTKKQVIEAIIAHRYTRPKLENTDLLELQQRDWDTRNKASAIRRELLLMAEGATVTVEGYEVKRQPGARYALATYESAPFATLEEAVKHLRTAPPPESWVADDAEARTDRAA